MDLLAIGDIHRYFNQTYVYYSGELVFVIVDGAGITLKGVHKKVNQKVSPESFCNNTEVLWPTAGFRRIGDGIYFLKYRRDGYKKAPTHDGMTFGALQHATKDLGDYYLSALFFPVFDDVVLCHMACVFEGKLWLDQRVGLPIIKKSSNFISVRESSDSCINSLVGVINKELKRNLIVLDSGDA